MPQILSSAEQEKHLELLTKETLDNFSMAANLFDVLIKYAQAKVQNPTATVQLNGAMGLITIPGTNCGFFAIPIMNMAMLDCRRSLEFFGLRVDHKANPKRLTTKTPRSHDTDLIVEDFGLPLVTPSQFLTAGSKATPVPLEPLILEVNEQQATCTLYLQSTAARYVVHCICVQGDD